MFIKSSKNYLLTFKIEAKAYTLYLVSLVKAYGDENKSIFFNNNILVSKSISL